MTWGSKEDFNRDSSANLTFLRDCIYNDQVSVYQEKFPVSLTYFVSICHKMMRIISLLYNKLK